MSKGKATSPRPLKPADFDFDGDTENATCDSCGYKLVHPIAVFVNRGGEVTAVDCDGTMVTKGEPSHRGVLIEVVYECEDGHRFSRLVQFHKGVSLVRSHRRPSNPLDFPDTLWRN